MSYIFKQGDQYVIDGVRRPYLTYTSFCLMGRYQNGQRDEARRWLDRLKLMGMDGPRLFGETWKPEPDAIFFGNPEWTSYARVIDEHQPPNSALKLLPRYPVWVEQLSEDLDERDMITEFCCGATIKHLPHIGMVLNRMAQMFAAMFDPERSPFLFETINEAPAHSGDLTLEEIALMGYRWHRDEGGDHTNFPGSIVGCSDGGNYEPSFNDSGYDVRNLHLPRGKYWNLGPNREPISQWLPEAKAATARVSDLEAALNGLGVSISDLLKTDDDDHGKALKVIAKAMQIAAASQQVIGATRPLALNEIIHFIDKREWPEWMRLQPNWAPLSTQNAVQVLEYVEEVLASGVSVCVHTRLGMSTNPNEQLSALDRMLVERAGNAPGPEPPPSPSPPPADGGQSLWEKLLEFLKKLFGL
jgi:hypothetical protein